MLYVVDASVFVAWLVPEECSDLAERLIASFRQGEWELTAPDIVAAEVGHALRRLVVNGELERQACLEGIDDFVTLDFPVTPSKPLMSRAARLALDNMATFYDSLYLALALERGVTLVTTDGRMTRAFSRLGHTTHLADLQI